MPEIDVSALNGRQTEFDFAVLDAPPLDEDEHPIDRGCEKWASTCTSCPYAMCVEDEMSVNGRGNGVRQVAYLWQTRALVFVGACPRCRDVGHRGAVMGDGDGGWKCLTCKRALVPLESTEVAQR